MSKNIPRVRDWLVREVKSGKRWIIPAPTKRLAILNARAGGLWCEIKVSPVRK